MASNVSDTEHLRQITLAPQGSWLDLDVRRSQDPEAKSFNPPNFDPKPVLYIPVKKTDGNEKFPKLVIHIELLEKEQLSNIQVQAWAGAKVNVTVRNIWRGNLGVRELDPITGTLDKTLDCFIHVSADTVKQWLDPDGPMKARLNEHLLEFRYEIPSITKDGAPLQGLSTNRVYLYRRKTIVFLPGLFASEFKVKLGDDKQAAFPNFFEDPQDKGRWKDASQFGRMLLHAKITSGERVGLLECDNQGTPLLEADKPMLLRLGRFKTVLWAADLQVEDFYLRCHGAVHDRTMLTYNRFPDEFRLFELQLFCYDWRCDLEQTAKDFVNNPQNPKRSLKHLHETLAKLPDTDDQVAIIGHSTGGVLIRRLLGESDASTYISHAFFVDAPFRGAPKALGVALTGCDPPGGDPMIPFINGRSMVSIAVTEPIVYHLAPSAKFPEPVISTPDNPDGCGDREKEKSSLLDSAADRGMYSPRYAVDPAKASDRVSLGRSADRWAEFWDGLADWYHARPAYRKWLNATAFAQFESDQLDPLFSDPELKEQYDSRTAMKWSPYLAARAKAFHEKSESLAKSGKWADKAYVFYSTGSPTPTTQKIKIELMTQQECLSPITLTEPNPSWQFGQGISRPSQRKCSGDGKQWVEYEQWSVENNKVFKRFWKLFAIQDKNGDGTVPLSSQIGFGGPVKVFKALPGAPDHVPAPNSEWMWERVIDVLLGYDVSEHLDNSVNPETGVKS